MKSLKSSLIATAFVLSLAPLLTHAQDDDKSYYSKRYDSLDVDTIFRSSRLLNNYVDCLLDKKPCPPEGKDLKRVLPHALRTKCARCTKIQKEKALDVITRLYYQHPPIYLALAERYDPRGEYTRNFENWFDQQQKENKKELPQPSRIPSTWITTTTSTQRTTTERQTSMRTLRTLPTVRTTTERPVTSTSGFTRIISTISDRPSTTRTSTERVTTSRSVPTTSIMTTSTTQRTRPTFTTSSTQRTTLSTSTTFSTQRPTFSTQRTTLSTSTTERPTPSTSITFSTQRPTTERPLSRNDLFIPMKMPSRPVISFTTNPSTMQPFPVQSQVQTNTGFIPSNSQNSSPRLPPASVPQVQTSFANQDPIPPRPREPPTSTFRTPSIQRPPQRPIERPGSPIDPNVISIDNFFVPRNVQIQRSINQILDRTNVMVNNVMRSIFSG